MATLTETKWWKYLTWTLSPGEIKKKEKENHNTQEIYGTNFKQKMKNADICVRQTPYNFLTRLEPVPSKVLVSPFTLTAHMES